MDTTRTNSTGQPPASRPGQVTAPGLPFMKMHGLGNDFVVFDARHTAIPVTPELAQAIADRHMGVGFDQLAVIESPTEPPEDGPENTPGADAHLVFYNADGSTSAACGNATRCIARHLMTETGKTALTLTTEHGALYAEDAGPLPSDNATGQSANARLTSVNMGPPVLDWWKIPLKAEVDTLHLPIDGDPVATSMGNPHCTFFVEDAEAVDLHALGPAIEHHKLYPQRTNVQWASLVAPDHLRMRVWERGVGPTLASGSSSCATAVAAARRGLTGRKVRIDLDGGTLWIDWREDGVWMTGPTAHVFTAHLTPDWLAAL